MQESTKQKIINNLPTAFGIFFVILLITIILRKQKVDVLPPKGHKQVILYKGDQITCPKGNIPVYEMIKPWHYGEVLSAKMLKGLGKYKGTAVEGQMIPCNAIQDIGNGKLCVHSNRGWIPIICRTWMKRLLGDPILPFEK